MAPEIFVYIYLIKEYYDYLLHSDLKWNLGWFGKYILVSPTGHKIHHSNDERHFNKNFGTFFVWWDKLFGTYLYTNDEIIIGVKNTELNKKGFWNDQYGSAIDFFKKSFSYIKNENKKR